MAAALKQFAYYSRISFFSYTFPSNMTISLPFLHLTIDLPIVRLSGTCIARLRVLEHVSRRHRASVWYACRFEQRRASDPHIFALCALWHVHFLFVDGSPLS